MSNRTKPVVVREFELQHREKSLLELIQTFPNQVIRGLALRQEAGWYFGRLYLIGAITRSEYQAAEYLDRTTRQYELMLRRYGHLHAVNLEKSSGATVEDLSLSAQKRFARAKKKYDEVYGALDQCGIEVRTAVVTALRREEMTDLEMIRRGLTVISTLVP